MKYKLKALSVVIGGRVHRKENGEIFDTEAKYKPLVSEVESAFKAGFLEEITPEAIPPKEIELKKKNSKK